ncbi:MAG: N5-glutamine methyltransferase family protein [Acidimicrobiales bacterium]
MFSPDLARVVLERLALAGCVAAEEEADELLSAAADKETLEAWIARRERGEPLAWITRHIDFGGLRLHVDPGVYVPRTQSEELAVRAGDLLPARGRAADLCTGSGAVAAHLMKSTPGATVVATDVDPRAAVCARRNGVVTLVADLDGGLSTGAFDVVTAVTPYVPTSELRLLPVDVQRWEPRAALDGGTDGLDTVRRLVLGAARVLRHRGWLLAEIGGDEDDAVEPLLAVAGFDRTAFWHDEDGDLRGLAAQVA